MLRYSGINNKRSTCAGISYQETLKRNKMLSLRARRLKHQLLFLFKLKKNDTNLSFNDFSL